MTRKRRIWMTVIVSCALVALAALVIGSSDASEESRGGASTAAALVIGVFIASQWRRLKENGDGGGHNGPGQP